MITPITLPSEVSPTSASAINVRRLLPSFQWQEETGNLQNVASIVFVLGGPGSGKGTQCPKIVEHFGYTHLCAGDLLEAEIKSGSENGEMIKNYKKEGKIVPAEVTVKLLQQAMQQSENKKFIIDGFPRNEDNRTAFENIIKLDPDFLLFLDCPEEELTKRSLNRNQGRIDDNIDTIKKRLKVYFESTLPVVAYYESKGKVGKVDAQKPIDEVGFEGASWYELSASFMSNLASIEGKGLLSTLRLGRATLRSGFGSMAKFIAVDVLIIVIGVDLYLVSYNL